MKAMIHRTNIDSITRGNVAGQVALGSPSRALAVDDDLVGAGGVAEARGATRRRVDSVDFLRGFAMIGLVLVHSVLYFTPLDDDVDLVYVVFAYLLGDTGAALFLTLVGVSFVLSHGSPADGPGVLTDALVRGVFLLAVAILVSVLTTGLDTIFEWDVLALIAIASVVLVFLRHLPSPVLLAIAAGIVLVSPWIRHAFGYLEWWGGSLAAVDGVQPEGLLVHPPGDFLPGLDLRAGAVGLLAAAWFPVFPWLAFPIVGMTLGRRLSADRRRTTARWMALGVGFVAAGLAVALLAVSRGDTDTVTGHLVPLSFTPDSTSMVLVQMGLVLVILSLTHLLMDGSRRMGRWMDPIRLVSRYALTVYVLSYVAIFLVIHLLDLMDPGTSHQYAVTTSGWALLFGIGFVGVMVPVLRVWDRHGGVASLEWTLARLRVRVTRPRTPAGS